MGNVQASSDVTRPKEDADKFRYIQLALQDIIQQLNGNIEITTNLKISIVDTNFASANVNTTINHNLGRVPQGYIEVGKSVSLNVYDGTVNSSTQTITLRSSAVGRAKLLFY